MKLTYIISEKFDELLTSVCAYIEDENVSIKKIKIALKGVTRLPTIYKDDEIITYYVDDVSDIILLIRSHCTYFNFRLLEKLIVVIKYSAGKHMMEKYKNDFCEYVQAIALSQAPHGGTGMDSDDEYTCVYLDESFKSCRPLYIDILKADICKILRIKEESLHISLDFKGKNERVL